MALFGGALGGVVGGATVKLFLDKSQFDAGLAQAKGQTQAGASTMGKFGGAAKAAFAVAGVAAAAFAVSSLKAFMESEQVMAQFQNTLRMMPQLAGETTDAFEEQATALQSLTGVQDEEIISADNILARFKLTGEQIRDAIPIVLDYAKAVGTDVPSAATNIGKALLGNTRALKTVGIEFTATGDTATDFASVLELLEGKVGGAAEAFGDTLAGRIDIANAKLDDFKETIGSFLASGLLLFTGDLHTASKMWMEVAEGQEGAIESIGQVASAYAAADAAIAGVALAQIEPTLQWVAAIDALLDPLDAAAAEAAAAAAAENQLAAATRDATQAANAARIAELSLAGGLIGVQAAASQLHDAQVNLHKVQRDSTASAGELRSAESQAFQAFLAVNGAVASYQSELRGATGASQTGERALHAMAGALGITDGAMRNYLSSVSAAASAQNAFNSALNAMPTHKDVTIVTHYVTVGTPGTAGGPQ